MKLRAFAVILPGIFVLSWSALACNAAHAQSGSLLWSHEVGGQLWAPLSHDEGSLYFGSDVMFNTVPTAPFGLFNITWQFASLRYRF